MLRAFLTRNTIASNVNLSRKTQLFSSLAEKVSVPNTTTSEPDVAPKEKSKNQLFREINPDMKLLNHLDSIRLGYLAKRSNRKAVARKIDNNQIDMQSMKVGDSYSKNTPFPFKAKGKLIHHAFTSDLIPHKFEGNPPEVAVIGRSNVGKSTLVNALIGFDASFIQRAPCSDKPGETKQLSFYQIGSQDPIYESVTPERFNMPTQTSTLLGAKDKAQNLLSGNANANGTAGLVKGGSANSALSAKVGKYESKPDVILQQKPKTPALVLVDMPGYGFAYAKEEDKERMHTLSTRYLFSNIAGGETGQIKENLTNIDPRDKKLKRVLLLLDARHGLKVADTAFFESLYQELSTEFAHLKDTPLTPAEVKKLQKNTYINSNNLQTNNTVEAIEKRNLDRFHNKLANILSWKLQIVLTKCDLIERTELCRRIQVLTTSLLTRIPPIFHNNLPIVILSGKDKKGLFDLQNELSVLVKKPADKLEIKHANKETKRIIDEKNQLLHGKKQTKLRLASEKEERILGKKFEKTGLLLDQKATEKSSSSPEKSTFAEKKPILKEKEAYFFNKGIVDTADVPVDNNRIELAPIEKFVNTNWTLPSSKKDSQNKEVQAQIEVEYRLRVEKNRLEDSDFNQAGSGTLFKKRNNAPHPNDDVYLERDEKEKKPKNTTNTNNFAFKTVPTVPKNNTFQMTTFADFFNKQAEKKFEEQKLSEKSEKVSFPTSTVGLMGRESESGDSSNDADDEKQTAATKNTSKSSVTTTSTTSSAPLGFVVPPLFVPSAESVKKANEAKIAAENARNLKAAVHAIKTTTPQRGTPPLPRLTSEVEKEAVLSRTGGRKRSPIPVRVNGKISFAEVVQSGDNLDENFISHPLPQHREDSSGVIKAKSTSKVSRTSSEVNEVEEEEEDYYVSAMTKVTPAKNLKRTATVNNTNTNTNTNTATPKIAPKFDTKSSKSAPKSGDYTVEFSDDGSEIIHTNEKSLESRFETTQAEIESNYKKTQKNTKNNTTNNTNLNPFSDPNSPDYDAVLYGAIKERKQEFAREKLEKAEKTSKTLVSEDKTPVSSPKVEKSIPKIEKFEEKKSVSASEKKVKATTTTATTSVEKPVKVNQGKKLSEDKLKQVVSEAKKVRIEGTNQRLSKLVEEEQNSFGDDESEVKKKKEATSTTTTNSAIDNVKSAGRVKPSLKKSTVSTPSTESVTTTSNLKLSSEEEYFRLQHEEDAYQTRTIQPVPIPRNANNSTSNTNSNNKFYQPSHASVDRESDGNFEFEVMEVETVDFEKMMRTSTPIRHSSASTSFFRDATYEVDEEEEEDKPMRNVVKNNQLTSGWDEKQENNHRKGRNLLDFGSNNNKNTASKNSVKDDNKYPHKNKKNSKNKNTLNYNEDDDYEPREKDHENRPRNMNSLRKVERGLKGEKTGGRSDNLEEIFKHASKEGFTRSAYDSDNGDALPASRPLRLNRKQKRLKKQAREGAVKEGKRFE